jgi:hypothetical protein
MAWVHAAACKPTCHDHDADAMMLLDQTVFTCMIQNRILDVVTALTQQRTSKYKPGIDQTLDIQSPSLPFNHSTTIRPHVLWTTKHVRSTLGARE